MNNPTVKLDLDSIINVDLVYEQNRPVLYSCLLCSIIFASLFLPFTIAFFIAFNLIKITARIDRPQMQRN